MMGWCAQVLYKKNLDQCAQQKATNWRNVSKIGEF